MSVFLFQPLIVTIEGLILCINIGDVHQFIGYCLIPLDVCIHPVIIWRWLRCSENPYEDRIWCVCVCYTCWFYAKLHTTNPQYSISKTLYRKKWQFLFFLSPYLSFLSCYIFQTSVPLSTSFPYTPLCVLVSPRFPTSRRIFTSVYDKVREKPVIVQTVIS